MTGRETLDGPRVAAGTYRTTPCPGGFTWTVDLCQPPWASAARSANQHEGPRKQRPHGPKTYRAPLTSLQSSSCWRSAKGNRLPGNKAAAPSSQSTASFRLRAGKGEACGLSFLSTVCFLYSYLFSSRFLLPFLSRKVPFPYSTSFLLPVLSRSPFLPFRHADWPMKQSKGRKKSASLRPFIYPSECVSCCS